MVLLNRAARLLEPTRDRFRDRFQSAVARSADTARSLRTAAQSRVRVRPAVAGAALAAVAAVSAPVAAAAIGHSDSAPAKGDVATVAQAAPVSPAPPAPVAPAAAVTPSNPLAGGAPAAGAPAAGAPAPAAPVPAAPAGPSAQDLHPVPVGADQESLNPSGEQIANARAIMKAGQAMHLPPRAWVIAIATSMQESQLKNIGDLGSANDHDSLGLFQQRPSSGWGSEAQIQDPNYAATAFYKGLVGVHGWKSMSLTDAAQAVQVSAYPDHYAKWEKVAGDMVNGFYGSGPYAGKIAKAK